MRWISRYWPAAAAGIIILLGFGAYWWQFGSSHWSEKPADWGVLGDYMGMALGAANFIVFLWLSLLVHRYNEAKDEKEDRLTTPLLVLSVSGSHYNEKRIYEVINVGQGAAINVLSSRVSATNLNINNPSWTRPVMCNSLLPNKAKDLRWTHNTWAIILLYTDSLNRQKISLCLDDQNYTCDYSDLLPDNNEAIRFKEVTLTMKQVKTIFEKQAKRYVEADPPKDGSVQDW